MKTGKLRVISIFVLAITPTIVEAQGQVRRLTPTRRSASNQAIQSRPRTLQNRQQSINPRIQAPTDRGSMDQAIALLRRSRDQFRAVKDYSCVFIKQEKIEGRLQAPEYMKMKIKQAPFSVYMQWLQPHQGREIIYVQGQNNGKILAHETGALKVAAGTVTLDPYGPRAMQHARHPVTKAGIGNLIEKVVQRWESEKNLGPIEVVIRTNAKVDGRTCTMIQTTRRSDPRRYLYYKDRLYIDAQTGLPVRFEGYGAPTRQYREGDPLEIYTYRNLQFNQTLTAADFSVNNPNYNFGRL